MYRFKFRKPLTTSPNSTKLPNAKLTYCVYNGVSFLFSNTRIIFHNFKYMCDMHAIFISKDKRHLLQAETFKYTVYMAGGFVHLFSESKVSVKGALLYLRCTTGVTFILFFKHICCLRKHLSS